MEMLQMAIEKKPDVSFPYLNLADLYVKLNEGDKALEVAQKGLALNPKDVLAYQKIAMAYAVKGDKDKCFENIKAMTDLGYDSTENMISLCNRILDKDPELWKL
jgi:tetratricopeptide (TPR) repeat protein